MKRGGSIAEGGRIVNPDTPRQVPFKSIGLGSGRRDPVRALGRQQERSVLAEHVGW